MTSILPTKNKFELYNTMDEQNFPTFSLKLSISLSSATITKLSFSLLNIKADLTMLSVSRNLSPQATTATTMSSLKIKNNIYTAVIGFNSNNQLFV